MKISLFTPHELVGFFLAWGIIWFVHSGINGNPFNSFLVVASFVGLVLLKVFRGES
ncbi:hypothetical protein [Halorussus halophilus]|uniref:hypothetical protein n=1 Tax=Halorussus halophilus TaxID=2650975 RepID=UPI0017888476|nr:hypothetical protein [Halorussus halophilus]